MAQTNAKVAKSKAKVDKKIVPLVSIAGTKRKRKRSKRFRRLQTELPPSYSAKTLFGRWGWFLLVVASLFSIVQASIPGGVFWVLGNLIEEAQNDKGNKDDIDKAIITSGWQLFVLAGIAGISSFICSVIFTTVGEIMATRIRRETFASIIKQDINFFDTHQSGVLLQRLGEDSQAIRDGLTIHMNVVIAGLGQFVVALGIAMYYSWELTLVMVGSIPIIVTTFMFQGYYSGKYEGIISEWVTKSTCLAHEVITGFSTVKSFNSEDSQVRKFNQIQDSILKLEYKQVLVLSTTLSSIYGAIRSTIGVAFLFGGFLVARGDLRLGKLSTVFGLMLYATISIGWAFLSVGHIFKGFGVLDECIKIITRHPRVPFLGGTIIPDEEFKGAITFKSVTFTYQTSDENESNADNVDNVKTSKERRVLSNLSFEVQAGEKIALVGESGSGKSTIFALLERFYEADRGKVMIDGIDITRLDPQWLHTQVALVSQEPILFSGTIEDNIRYGKRDATREDVIEAAKMANVYSFIMKLPDGFNTLINEKGVNISGGQKQRIAIARAVLKNPKILLLDEATSALDSETEQIVQQALEKLMKGRTTLIIAHRLSTIQSVDAIYKIHKGKVVARFEPSSL